MESFIFNTLKERCVKAFKPILYLLLALLFIKKWSSFFHFIEINKNKQIPSICKSIYFCFRTLPLKYAKVIPIYIYKDTQIMDLSGSISIEAPVTSGMIKWGYDWGHRCIGKSRVRIEGRIVFKGSCRILQGSDICVFDKGIITIGNDSLIGENCLIYCMESITIGDTFRLTYQSQLFDTDFHYTIDINTQKIRKKTSPIVIGSHVWVGNRANIKKGTHIPDYTIVSASGTVLTKNYNSIVTKFGCLGGVPARPLPINRCRTWNEEQNFTAFLDNWFVENPNMDTYTVHGKEIIEKIIETNID